MKKRWFFAVLSAVVLLCSGCVVENEETPRPIALDISMQPIRISYAKNEPLDLSGLVVKLYKTDGSSELLQKGTYTTEPRDGSTLVNTGNQKVTVSAEGLSADFAITVVAPGRLEISTKPMKMLYKKGEMLHLSGLEVKLCKTDGTSKMLEQYTTEPADKSILTTLGRQPVKIKAEGLETTFDIIVAGLEILNMPLKTDYSFYTPLDLSGLKVKLYRTDGSCEELSEGQYEVSPKDNSMLEEAGRQPVTITAGEQEETFEISVSDEYIVVDDVSDEYVVVDNDNGNHILMNVPAKVKEKAGKITVPESIVEIGGKDTYEFPFNSPDCILEFAPPVFNGCSDNLTEIKLLGGIKRVCAHAFEGFSGVVTVADGASNFECCITLQKVIIEDGVTEIAHDDIFKMTPGLFYECRNLTSIEIPDSVTKIGESAFEGCSSLTSVKIPEGITEIERAVFFECRNLTSIEIPDCVTKIGQSAFGECKSLQSIVIPEGVAEIERAVFWGCRNLTSVEIPDSVTKIGQDAFKGCKRLQSVKIPGNVTEIRSNAFSDTGIRIVHYDGTAARWNNIVVFHDDKYLGTMSDKGKCCFNNVWCTIICSDDYIYY